MNEAGRWVELSYRHRGRRYFFYMGLPQARTYRWLPSIVWGYVGPAEKIL